MNIFNIKKSFKDKKAKNWEKLYWLIDLHETIITGTYTQKNKGAKFYPNALKVLKKLSDRPDVVLVLWTSSYKANLMTILKKMARKGIYFDYINENPECFSNELCDFSLKPYFNVLLDDKAGFNADKDWLRIEKQLKKIGEWNKNDKS